METSLRRYFTPEIIIPKYFLFEGTKRIILDHLGSIGKSDLSITHMLHGAGIFTNIYPNKITQFCR